MTVEASTPAPSTGATPPPRFFWERPHAGGRPDGADLAALRRGAGRDPGTVPQMWRYYTTLNQEGWGTPGLRAEHAALVLFAMHQQSQTRLMHAAGVGLGAAVRCLRESDKFSSDAVDRRFEAAATATSLSEASYHLRGLVRQLRGLPQPLDYTRLYWDLLSWQNPDRIGQVRRRWGSQYFPGRDRKTETAVSTTS
ncbi:type I-E CRISPR-associated protein Cse2/CasB [Frankia sp. Mgl5]|uniref:type I-E CRISPR-associated protein Cse2/CasB n=1 Tax=Frankia sp. Mgl5 TaxID=2933793 RepID=UPI00200D2E73|nr:type I-E CRISPR-associated protein Cse2/CasB [Frankia sp. Mgl5]MCK9929611.1 type I-E CRISPR-associated protein Cse2/CasB [Frankia sp. Mgl5]